MYCNVLNMKQVSSVTEITPMTRIEQSYVNQGYHLPPGYTWELVAQLRKKWNIREIFVPLALVSGVVLSWGVPMIGGQCLKHE